MSGCDHCCGSCEVCGKCAGSIVLNAGELNMLEKLRQIPFLPVARSASSLDPIYLEDSDCSVEEYTMILRSLDKKGLISIDFDQPLTHFAGQAYAAYPIRGSFALTARGQEVLDVLEVQGIGEA